MSLLYLLMKNDSSFSGSKIIISLINIVFMVLYLIFMIKDKRDWERIGYFLVTIVIAILLFGGLARNSWINLQKTSEPQNYSIVLLTGLFIINSVINLWFLVKSESSDEIGIISNRKKIMIPIISLSIYTVTVIYCFYYTNGDYKTMIGVAVYVTLYEIAISLFKFRNEISKIIWCVVTFIFFVFTMPVIIRKNTGLQNELALNWLILVGVSIYMAAIKYWGYIIKFQFSPKETNQSTEKKMNMTIWFRNSILGSMLFVAIILLASNKYFFMLFIIIVCSIISELFIFSTFHKQIENNNRLYLIGRILEFFAIISPIVGYVCETNFDFSITNGINFSVDHISTIVVSVGMIMILLQFLYILHQYDKGEPKEKKKDKESEPEFLQISTQVLLSRIWKALVKIVRLFFQVLPDQNMKNLCRIAGVSLTYILLQMIALVYAPFMSVNSRIWGLFVTSVIIVVDWFILSRKMIVHYIIKMKIGRYVMRFKDVFNQKWTECLNTLKDFKEIDAEQFYVGDRIRPILFFMGSSYGSYDNLSEEDYNNIAKAACSLELIHKSSIILDDYIDGDAMRKGKEAFHVQYDNLNKMILLVNAMLAWAPINFAECRDSFKCSEKVAFESTKKLSEITLSLCRGCYKELSRGNYDTQNEEEVRNIISLETVSLIRGSIELGYICFHDEYGNKDYENLSQLGEAFGYIFQYLNDLEPFSQKDLYEQSKGTINNFDQGKKNIALLDLYNKVSREEKESINGGNYEVILRLYQKYAVEQDILNKVRNEIDKMKKNLDVLRVGNQKWVEAFVEIFNMAIEVKGWQKKIPSL